MVMATMQLKVSSDKGLRQQASYSMLQPAYEVVQHLANNFEDNVRLTQLDMHKISMCRPDSVF